MVTWQTYAVVIEDDRNNSQYGKLYDGDTIERSNLKACNARLAQDVTGLDDLRLILGLDDLNLILEQQLQHPNILTHSRSTALPPRLSISWERSDSYWTKHRQGWKLQRKSLYVGCGKLTCGGRQPVESGPCTGFTRKHTQFRKHRRVEHVVGGTTTGSLNKKRQRYHDFLKEGRNGKSGAALAVAPGVTVFDIVTSLDVPEFDGILSGLSA